MKLFNLEDKRVLITGASSGIGRACAVMASEMGASVVLTGRRLPALEETLSMMDNRDRHAIIAGDIGDRSFVQGLFEGSGPFDGLVHAAGVCSAVPAGMISEELLVESMRVNYFAFMELMRFCSKKKFVGNRFSAVAISSVSADAGWSGGSLYSGSKGALSSAVRALALELAPKGFRVNAVCPSNIKTPMFDALAGAINDEEGLKRLNMFQPLGVGTPEQVAAPVCFLLSDAASFITGVNLPVDGGYLAQ